VGLENVLEDQSPPETLLVQNYWSRIETCYVFARGKIGDECLMMNDERRFVSADEEYAAAMFLDDRANLPQLMVGRVLPLTVYESMQEATGFLPCCSVSCASSFGSYNMFMHH